MMARALAGPIPGKVSSSAKLAWLRSIRAGAGFSGKWAAGVVGTSIQSPSLTGSPNSIWANAASGKAPPAAWMAWATVGAPDKA